MSVIIVKNAPQYNIRKVNKLLNDIHCSVDGSVVVDYNTEIALREVLEFYVNNCKEVK